ncbi:mannose-6-phosphate isomerase, class I [Streptomyces sp. NEAU-sy36]|uniref:mannose-6-phosphate isomerase, class I n=1 Tax=unclassified Streptomyces TaxID=2593676 RepID=UPI0015D5FEE3|nr:MULTISPECIES: mannose-6-phosphate isomerase, class I [unclassified Streptomyces]QLJ02981.1 mannose-6-phosphate isomerase, class I [Streptomyces sp. NEAU-sy36]
MDLLHPIIKPYPWGSRDALARLQGRGTPSPGPEAELWLGAHPSGPARLTRDGQTLTLLDVVSGDPEKELGRDCAARFDGRLPFLLKVLAAEAPLSIQVHPDREQARAAFAAQRTGTGTGTGTGAYADDWPKPELLCALTPFEVLAGFRGREEAVAVLDGLDVPGLRPVTATLRTVDGDAALTAALRAVLDRSAQDRDGLVDEVVRACARSARVPGPHAGAYDAVVRMARHHPGDPGLVASLLLRHRVLEPGTALFMPAGGLHAYIRGVGVEVMACSDNVVRAGLTSKQVDVPELLRITDPAARVPVVLPRTLPGPGGGLVYDCPAEEFALYRTGLTASPAPLTPSSGPRIALCLDGTALLRAPGGEVLPLGPGASCFLPDSDHGITAEGTGTLFVAGPGGSEQWLRRAG